MHKRSRRDVASNVSLTTTRNPSAGIGTQPSRYGFFFAGKYFFSIDATTT